MIAFAACIGSEAKFRRCAVPGIRLAAEPDSPVVEATTEDSIFEAYNEVLDALAGCDDLEGLVLLHEDTEIVDPGFCEKLRLRLADPGVAVVGVVGARGVTSLSWWEGETFGRVVETRGLLDFGGGTHAVDAVDGLVLALSPWAVRNLRFDAERFRGFHGYDVDFCFQARAAGRKVLVDELAVVHHTKGGFGDGDAFRTADRTWRSKWLNRPRPDADPSATAHVSGDCLLCGTAVHADASSRARTVVECPGCGVGITLPEPSRDVKSEEIFTEQYSGNRLALRGQWVKEARARLRWVQRIAPAGSLLEIGCATGEFLAEAADAGYEVVGMEASTWAASLAREYAGVPVYTEELDSWRRAHPGERFDAIVLFHVLEHVFDPREFVHELRELVTPGGRVLVEVPNFAAAAARLDPVGWAGVAIDDHVLHYTPRSLARLFEGAGFQPLGSAAFSYKLYDSEDVWRQRCDHWRRQGLARPSDDLLRAVFAVP